MQQQNPEHKCLKFLTPSVKKIVNLHGFKYIYKPRYINAFFWPVWIIMIWQCTPREMILKDFKKCCTSKAVETMICCGMRGKRMGMLEVSVRKVKALLVKMETVTLSG